MLLGVVSDTHGHAPFTLEAVAMLESFQVDAVLHCGDIGSPAIPPLFADWPTHFVMGNVDRSIRDELRDAIIRARLTDHNRFGDITLEDVRIALLHGDDEPRLAATIAAGEHRLVCCGHTHVASQEQRGETPVLNPGAVYRATPRSIAVVELPKLKVTPITL